MHRDALRRSACILLSAAGLVTSLVAGSPDALATPRKVRKSQPVSPARAAPDTTATIVTPKPPEQDEILPKPFELPSAPRARMRACGERWQTIKLAGQAADQTWREFATKCLAQADAPRPTPPR